MDLARGMNIDLEPAAQMVAMALAERRRKPRATHKIFGDTIPKGASFAEIMQAINDKFGGQYAGGYGDDVGATSSIKNQMSDINEQIGKVLADNLKTIIELFKSLPEAVQNALIAVVAIGTALAPVLVSFTALA